MQTHPRRGGAGQGYLLNYYFPPSWLAYLRPESPSRVSTSLRMVMLACEAFGGVSPLNLEIPLFIFSKILLMVRSDRRTFSNRSFALVTAE